jgi:hypothetical protein
MEATKRRIPTIISTKIFDNTPLPLRGLLHNPDWNTESSQQINKRIKAALRVVMVHERLGWMGILGGGWMTKTYLDAKHTSQRAWNDILTIVQSQAAWILDQIKEQCEMELKWLEETV